MREAYKTLIFLERERSTLFMSGIVEAEGVEEPIDMRLERIRLLTMPQRFVQKMRVNR